MKIVKIFNISYKCGYHLILEEIEILGVLHHELSQLMLKNGERRVWTLEILAHSVIIRKISKKSYKSRHNLRRIIARGERK